jgi:hypothetical protein
MGLGGGPSWRDDYEWVRLADLPETPPPAARAGRQPLADAVLAWLAREGVWTAGAGSRVLLVDLDNLRADPVRWRDRMAMVVALAREADVVALAGQQGAVDRAGPHLGELAARARAVADGSDLADHVLLDAAAEVAGPARFVLLSNDWIFAALAERGPLTVLSPGGDALSDRLRAAAARVVDLVALEGSVPQPGRKAAFRATRRRRVRV